MALQVVLPSFGSFLIKAMTTATRKTTLSKICLHFTVEFRNKEAKQATTATATRTPLNKRFNELKNSCARAL